MRAPWIAAGLLALTLAGTARADNAELVTVTTDSAVITWTTSAPGDSTVCVDDAPCVAQEQGMTLHRVEVDGLKPGSTHRYRVQTNGTAEALSITNPQTFTTLTPPPGKELFRFAVMNDLHVGEGCAGTITSSPLTGQSIPPCFSAPMYAQRMDTAEVDELHDKGIDLLLINGDVSAEAKLVDLQTARTLLDRLHGTVLVARGNHDRVHNDADHPCGSDHDCFRDVFYPGRASGRDYASITRHGQHFIALDSVKGSSTGDLTDAAQNAWLAKDLADHKSEVTWIFFHHPASVYGDTYEAEPIIFGVPPQNGQGAFLDTVAANPQIAGVFQAHTHRNFVSYGRNDNTPFIENGAAKEYPGGYSVITVYEGGYTRSFFRAACAFCREWTQTTSGEDFGLAPMYLLGSLGTRNFTHVYGCSTQIPATSLPGNDSLLTGGVLTPPASCLDHVVTRGTPGPDEGGGMAASFALKTRTAHVRRGSGTLQLTCTSTASCVASGRVVTTVGHRVLTLATAHGTVRGGATARVRLVLGATGRRVLARRRGGAVRAHARLRVQLAPGDVRAVGGRITLAR